MRYRGANGHSASPGKSVVGRAEDAGGGVGHAEGGRRKAEGKVPTPPRPRHRAGRRVAPKLPTAHGPTAPPNEPVSRGRGGTIPGLPPIPPMLDTIFDRIVRGEAPAYRVWEDDAFLAFLDTRPSRPGHVLLIPKEVPERGGDDVFALPPDVYAALWERARRLAGPVREAMGARRVGAVVEGFGGRPRARPPHPARRDRGPRAAVRGARLARRAGGRRREAPRGRRGGRRVGRGGPPPPRPDRQESARGHPGAGRAVRAPCSPRPPPPRPAPASGPTTAPPRPEAIPIAAPARRRFRQTRAYAAALRVALSYLWFDAVAALRGPAWARRRRAALHRRNGRRVREAVLRLRGLFIKAGQLASVLTQLLPEPFREELACLQDRVPAGPPEAVRARVREELGAEPGALFAAFDEAPVASASLAQVHRARLADGRDVAVKVQHADIEAIARIDLRAIETILRVVGRWFGVRDLREQFREIEAVVLAELDFAQEAASAEAIGAVLGEGVSVPAVVPERSARRVLTTEFVDGLKAGDLAGLDAAGVDRGRAGRADPRRLRRDDLPRRALPRRPAPGQPARPGPRRRPAPRRSRATAWVPSHPTRPPSAQRDVRGDRVPSPRWGEAGRGANQPTTPPLKRPATPAPPPVGEGDSHPSRSASVSGEGWAGRPLSAPTSRFELVFLDFGAVARLTPGMRTGLAEMVAGVLARDAARVTAALDLMGFVAEQDGRGGAADAAVLQLVERVHERVLRGVDPDAFRLGDLTLDLAVEVQAGAFDDMADLGVSVGDLASAFRVPRDWILLERTALLLIGLCTALDPDANPLRVLRPHIEPVVGDLGAAAGGAVAARAQDALRTALGLPARLDRVLAAAEGGALAVRSPDALRAADRVYAGLRQVAYTLGAAGAGGVAYAAHLAGEGGVATALAVVGGACVLGAAGSALRERRRRG